MAMVTGQTGQRKLHELVTSIMTMPGVRLNHHRGNKRANGIGKRDMCKRGFESIDKINP